MWFKNFFNRYILGKKKNTMQPHNARPVKTRRKVLLSTISVFLVIVVSLTVFVSGMLARINVYSIDQLSTGVDSYTPIEEHFDSNPDENSYDEIDSLEPVVIGDRDMVSDEAVQNILIIGDDSARKGETGRSDTMILLSIDRKNSQIKMTSIMRDSYVAIPGKGSNRINASYNSGGVKLAVETVEHNFGVDIDNYVKVGFNSFEKIIDKMGGIQVQLTSTQAKYMTTYGVSNFTGAGVWQMGGADALQYVRMRRFDDDFKRTGRQRDVVEQLMGKIAKYNTVDLTNLMTDVLPAIDTDISRAELIAMIAEVTEFAGYEIKQFSIPANGTWQGKSINKAAVLVIDVDENARQLADFIYTADFDPANPSRDGIN